MMNSVRSWPLVVVLFLAVGASAGRSAESRAAESRAAESRALAAALESITAADVQRHVDLLADDTLEGREEGSRGGRAAGGYLVTQLRKLGLHGGAAGGGFYQPLPSGGRNVLAIVPGRDAKLAQEVILLGAHYDHVGYGNRSNSFGPTGYIHNGADDNASGTAGLLELAEALTKLPSPAKRSLLLVWWDGEENGMLGSKHWLAEPTVARSRVKTAINLDMIGRLRKDRLQVLGTRTAHGLRQLVSERNDVGFSLDFRWEMKNDSDHYTFFDAGIPVLMMHTGLHDDYHRPSDDAHKINADGIQRVVRLLLGVTLELAEADAVPQFRSDGRDETTETQRWQFERPAPPPPGRLGVGWSTAPIKDGLRIERVEPGSAAERAGLGPGDRVLRLGGELLTNDEQLQAAVLAAPEAIELEIRPNAVGTPPPLAKPQAETRAVRVKLDGKPTRLGLAWRPDEAEPGAVTVVQVLAGSPAARAGIKVHDRIYRIAGQRPKDSDDVFTRLTTLPAPIEMQIEREGRLRSMTLDPLPPAPASKP